MEIHHVFSWFCGSCHGGIGCLKFFYEPKRISSLGITLIRNLSNWIEKHILPRPKTNSMAIYIYNKYIDSINPKYINDISTTKEWKCRLWNVPIIDQTKVLTNNREQISFKAYGANINLQPKFSISAIYVKKKIIKSRNGPKWSCSIYFLLTWLR